MEKLDRGYTIGIGDIVVVNGTALIALALFVRIVLVTFAIA